jgi:hypothetical protein
MTPSDENDPAESGAGYPEQQPKQVGGGGKRPEDKRKGGGEDPPGTGNEDEGTATGNRDAAGADE